MSNKLLVGSSYDYEDIKGKATILVLSLSVDDTRYKVKIIAGSGWYANQVEHVTYWSAEIGTHKQCISIYDELETILQS